MEGGGGRRRMGKYKSQEMKKEGLIERKGGEAGRAEEKWEG
jgi:hypothetical protein